MSSRRVDTFVELARQHPGVVSPATLSAGERRVLGAWRPRSSMGRYASLAVAAAVTLAALGGFAHWSAQAPSLAFSADGVVREGQSLRVPAGEKSGEVTFSDGSRVVLAPGSSSHLHETTPFGARLELDEGAVHWDVVPRPNARWTLEAGPFSVVVHGTAFDVRWAPTSASLDVALARGAITVTGPGLGQGVPLAPGQRLRVRGSVVSTGAEEDHNEGVGPSARAPEPPSPEPDAPGDEEPTLLDRPRSARAAAPRRSWEKMTAAGDTVDVLREANAPGLAHSLATRPAGDLLALGDAARYERQQLVARRAYAKLRQRFPGARAAADAAFFLGRIDEASSPRDAERWYLRYLEEAPGGAYAAEALGRAMIMADQVDPARARSLAAEYLRRNPSGSLAATARAIEAR